MAEVALGLSSVRVRRLPSEFCPLDGPPLVIRDAVEALAPEGPFGAGRPDTAPAGRPLILWIRIALLDTPDRLTLVAARVEQERLAFELEHRDFEGILGANVVECGAVEAELAALGRGSYEVATTVKRLLFTDPERPERARPGETRTERATFHVTEA